jgi:hypothetical protein
LALYHLPTMKSINDNDISDIGSSGERDLFYANKISPFSRSLFLRSLHPGTTSPGLRKVGFVYPKNLLPELDKLSRSPTESSISALQPYYGRDTVADNYGAIAPWCQQPIRQCNFHIRIAAETIKHYPWATTKTAAAACSDYLFTRN